MQLFHVKSKQTRRCPLVKARDNGGFTLIELAVALAIMAILAVTISTNLVGYQTKSQIDAIVLQLNSDIKQQQIKAMTGITEAASSPGAFGVYFEPQQYTLFEGSTYNTNDPNNFIVPLESGFTLSNVQFADNSLVFSPGSGEIANYVSGQDSIQISGGAGDIATISLNEFGVFTNIQ
ncbi:prepilin-type N-terminal cleavage/methylation domain-containing protein [Candidatus Woesebacteria bacterium]|nr:prepilin-type N-terminal cleavage/methylation domain-containing protein [Candidatus Woesebacteria bacterium]